MRCKAILKGFPLRVNISLLAIAVICAAISSLSDKETLRITCLVAGWLSTLAAMGPSSSGFAREQARRGKGRYVDPDTIVPGWKQFCQSMGIEEDIKVKVFPNLRNAYRDGTTIEIGQPILDNLDSVSIKAVFAHELAHIKIDYALTPRHLLWCILVIVVVALVPSLVFAHSVRQLSSHLLIFIVLLIWLSFIGIAIRFISWPNEYEADLIAKQYVNRDAVVSFLTAVAALRKMDVMRDFYRHPSITKRIANLDWPQKTRFKKWYFEL